MLNFGVWCWLKCLQLIQVKNVNTISVCEKIVFNLKHITIGNQTVKINFYTKKHFYAFLVPRSVKLKASSCYRKCPKIPTTHLLMTAIMNK